MKTILIQNASGETHEAVLKKVAPWHAAYCKRHDISYLSLFGRPTGHHPERVPEWDCNPLIEAAFNNFFDLIVFLDVDALIVRDVDLREAAKEFEHVGAVRHPLNFREGESCGHFNVGALYLRNTWLARQFIRESDELGPIPNRFNWHEQAAMIEVNDRIGAISRIADRWNATEGVNECEKPVVRAWHGQSKRGLIKLEQVLERLQSR